MLCGDGQSDGLPAIVDLIFAAQMTVQGIVAVPLELNGGPGGELDTELLEDLGGDIRPVILDQDRRDDLRGVRVQGNLIQLQFRRLCDLRQKDRCQ